MKLTNQIKYFLKTMIIFLALLMLAAPSCEDERETAEREDAIIEETKMEIREEFEASYLTDASLFVFETNAKQKLSDFFDYLKILADTAQEKTFRLKAGEMIEKSFVQTNVSINLVDTDPERIHPMEIQKFVNMLLNNELLLHGFKIDSVFVFKPFYRTGSENYTGELKFLQKLVYDSSYHKSIPPIERTADIYLNKEDKIFGNDTLKVWNVRLGDIL